MQYPRRFVALLVTALIPSACSGLVDVPALPEGSQDSLPRLDAPPPPVLTPDGRLLLSGSATVHASAGQAPVLSVSVLARNVTAEAISRAGLCVVQIRVHPGDSTRIGPVWVAPAQPVSTCEDPVIASIPPGAKQYVHGAEQFGFTPVATILGSSLPNGRYAVTALVRFGDNTIQVPAGTVSLARDTRAPLTDPRVLQFAAATTVEGIAPRYLVTRVVAANPTDRNVYLEFGACSLQLRAYRNAERSGAPVWRSEYRSPPGTRVGYACLAYLATALVTPGVAISPREFTIGVPVHEVLADSLPDGRYWFTAELRFLHTSESPLRETRITMPAGTADLTARVDPLPQERSHGGVRYRVDTAPAGAGSARVTLTLTNTTAERIFIAGSRSVTCASTISGFRSEARRDQWYLPGSPEWIHPGCPFTLPTTWLAAGEQRTFTTTINGAGSPGLYHLLVVLWTEHDPGGDARLVLSGGSAQLN